MSTTPRLLPPEALLKTGEVDHADWNYPPVLGWIQRLRFRLVLSLLPPERVGCMLEVGYGSGVFLPELARHCWELHGTDPHGRAPEVQDALSRFGVHARLQTAPAERLPFPSRSLDVVVAVSVLEFVADIEAACREIRRVLRPDGRFVLVTPGASRLVSAAASLLSGRDADRDFGRRRALIRPALARHFEVERAVHLPAVGGAWLRWYDAYRLVPRALTGMAADVVAASVRMPAEPRPEPRRERVPPSED